MTEWQRKTFETELLSEANNMYLEWYRENETIFVFSVTQVFNPDGKSSITVSYKDYNDKNHQDN
jgi:hypothetical protein